MNYAFPTIETIDDVLPAINGKEEFIVSRKDGYDVINYVVRTAGTFPPVVDKNTAILRECRGLIFDKSGVLLSRPLHKFFNIGETEETAPHNIDLSREHDLLLKLDGSMIRPVFINQRLRWCTKMGVTDVSILAEQLVARDQRYVALASDLLAVNHTPIFEFTTPENRIVIFYDQPQMTLIAVRNNKTGEYYCYERLLDLETRYNIPVVFPLVVKDINDIKNMTDIEGIVVSFLDGHKVKLKSDHYVLIHKTKEQLFQEKNVIRAIIDEKTDDIIPLLPEVDGDKLRAFVSTFWEELGKTIAEVSIYVDAFDVLCDRDKKRFALEYANILNPLYRSIVFAAINGANVYATVIAMIGNYSSSATKLDYARSLWGGLRWK